MKKALVVLIMIGILLLSSVSVMASVTQAQSTHQKLFKPIDAPLALQWHYLNPQDAKRMIERAKQIENSESIQVVDGHFTGFKPSTPRAIDSAIGKMQVVTAVAAPRSLPTHVDLSKDPRFPAVGNQGQQGSCAAWAVTYYNEGWLQAYVHNWTDAHTGYNKHHLMSPAWTYNKVNGGTDQGSGFVTNMLVLWKLGGASMYTMPYNDHDYTSWGDEAAWREAPQYRIADGYMIDVENVTNTSAGTQTPPTPQQVENLTNTIKTLISEGYPVNFAIDADEYTNIFNNGGNFIISYSEYDANGTPNHAQTIVGYNDSITDNGDKGAFKVVNSWGTGWGASGYYWITYKALYKILMMGQGWPDLYFMVPRHHYEPKLLAVWTLDPNHRGTRITPIDLGIGSPSHPIQIENSVFGNITSYNGGDLPFPTFLAVDLTDFMGNVSMNSTNEFFLYAHRWSKEMVITSFHIEYYKNVYIPGEPYEVSPNSPDVPATQSSSQAAIVRAYLRPIQSFHAIRINSNADFTPANGVIGGNGTQSNPYVIAWWDINANGSKYAIYIGNTTAYFVIAHSYIHNASSAGIYLYNTTNGYIMENKLYDNYYGIKFTESYENTLASNQFMNNTHPMYISYSSNLQYYKQTIYPNNTVMGKPMYYITGKDITLKNLDVGYIGIYQSTNITLTNITLNGTDEIFIEDSSHVSLLHSLIKNARWGVSIRYSKDVTIFANYFNYNEYGVQAYKTSYSTINNNTFTGNYYGVKLVYSHNITVYHNNFVSNVHQAYDNQNNTWSLAPPIGGNFWSDYNGTDADHNGFGDTPYTIPGGSAKDYYPLMKAWDNVPPKVTISNPPNGKIFGTSSVTVYWNGTDNIGIAYYEVRIDSGQWVKVSNTTTHYTFQNLQDGKHTAYVVAYDFSGNNATAEVTFDVDTTPPTITIVSPAQNSYVNTSNVIVKWTYKDQNQVGFMVAVDNNLPQSVGSATQFTANGLRDGSHKVTVIGIDAAGNKNTAVVSFTIDTIKPTVMWNMSISNGAWINQKSLTLRWIASDNVAVNYTEILVDSGNWINVGNVMSYTLTNLTDGSHTVLLRVYDMAGNYNETSFSFNIDTIAPNVTIISPESNAITNESTVNVQWKGSDNIGIAYYEIKVDNGQWKKVGNVTSYTLNLQDGQHTIYIKAVDKAGNYKVTEVKVTVDTQPPTVQITTPSANSNITAKYVVVSWSGSDNIGIAYYEVKIDNGTWTKVGLNTSYNFTSLKEGSHTVYVKAVDKAGNSQTTSVTFNVKPASSGLNFGGPTGVTIGISILIIIIIIVIIAIAVTKSKAKSKREPATKEDREEIEEETEENEEEVTEE